MNEELIVFQYSFVFPDGRETHFHIPIDGKDLSLRMPGPEVQPPWTLLGFSQCPHCPLDPSRHERCPAAANLVAVIHAFEGLSSHDPITLKVVSNRRTVIHDTTAQRAIGSMMGLLFATCGCPHTAFFRPMARFHLPLASEAETIYRATSMYLLAQYFKRREGKEADFDLNGLASIYKNIQIVNLTIAERIRGATATDSSINAVIFLDLYAKAMPYVIRDALEEVRYLFSTYLSDEDPFHVSR